MANIKVSEMTEATSFDDGDYTMIVQANQNKKISKENIFSNLENEISTNASDISTINTNIGNLSNLATEDKTSIVNSINELKNAEIYSTEEIKTNKVWIDTNSIEHPVYRKTIIYNGTFTSGRNSIAHNISNILSIVSYNGFAPFGTNTFYLIGAYESNTNFINIKNITENDINVEVGSGWAKSFTNGCTINLEYTKRN